jgi:DNA/RNA endonuclease YhcR with UshA esterase domain
MAACSKSGTTTDEGGGSHIQTPSDTIPPQISIFTPTINQVFNNGNVINITGRITDDYGLYRGTIRVINDANGAVLFSQSYEIHGTLLYNFNINYTASVAVASDYTVTVSFEDHGLNSTSKTVKVKVNP